MSFSHIFSDFLYEKTLNFDNNNLLNYLQTVTEHSTGRKVSNYGGYQSNDLENNEYTYPLLELISSNIEEVQNNIGLKKSRLKLHNFWCNINHEKDFNVAHTHPQSILSGVFYLKTPDNCGNLILKNRNADLIKCYFDYWHLKEQTDYAMNEFNSQVWRVVPKENNLIMFPSWVEHYVEPNQSTEPRISIAFNYGY